MSVTFSTTSEVQSWSVLCSCGKNVLCGPFPTFAEGENALGDVQNTCADEYCQVFPAHVSADEQVYVNLSNINARFVLENLGFVDEENLSGICSAEDFLGRVLMAYAVAPADLGVMSTSSGIMVECGRPEGYLQETLQRLEALAMVAVEENVSVSWC